MALTDTNGEVIVASKKKIVVWNYETMSVVNKFKLNFDGGHKHLSLKSLLQIYLPHNCVQQTGELYAIAAASGKKNLRHLFRIQLAGDNEEEEEGGGGVAAGSNLIFRHVTLSSQHVGDGGNTLVSLSDHKVHGFLNATLLCYDRRLAKVQTFNTDKDRPFTVARCHPLEKVIACGDTSGRVLIFTCQAFGEELTPAKSILHW